MLSGGVALLWGPPRSGTTWLYNVVREIVSTADVRAAGWVYGHPAPDPADFDSLVVKSHQAHSLDVLRTLVPHPHIHIVGIFRDPVHAYQSLLRTQDVDRGELIEWLTRDIESIDTAFSSFPDAVVMREEWIAPRASEAVAALARLLRVHLTPEAGVDIARRYQRDRVRESVQNLADHHGWSDHFRHYDTDSHWHSNHIAPDDHQPLAITAGEHQQLEHLSRIVDRLTARHSLLAGVPDRRHRQTASPVSHEFLRASARTPRRSMLSRLRRASR